VTKITTPKIVQGKDVSNKSAADLLFAQCKTRLTEHEHRSERTNEEALQQAATLVLLTWLQDDQTANSLSISDWQYIYDSALQPEKKKQRLDDFHIYFHDENPQQYIEIRYHPYLHRKQWLRFARASFLAAEKTFCTDKETNISLVNTMVCEERDNLAATWEKANIPHIVTEGRGIDGTLEDACVQYDSADLDKLKMSIKSNKFNQTFLKVQNQRKSVEAPSDSWTSIQEGTPFCLPLLQPIARKLIKMDGLYGLLMFGPNLGGTTVLHRKKQLQCLASLTEESCRLEQLTANLPDPALLICTSDCLVILSHDLIQAHEFEVLSKEMENITNKLDKEFYEPSTVQDDSRSSSFALVFGYHLNFARRACFNGDIQVKEVTPWYWSSHVLPISLANLHVDQIESITIRSKWYEDSQIRKIFRCCESVPLYQEDFIRFSS
jgi:hypothetical protein